METLIKILQLLSIPIISLGGAFAILCLNSFIKTQRQNITAGIILKYIACDARKFANIQDEVLVNHLFCVIIKNALASSNKKAKIELYQLCEAYNWINIAAKYESDLKKRSLREFTEPLRRYGFYTNMPLSYNSMDNAFICAILFLTSKQEIGFERNDALKIINYCLQKVFYKQILIEHIIEHFEDKTYWADENTPIKEMSVDEFKEYLSTIPR